MARPLRLEFPGAFYHLTAVGNAGGRIYLDDTDCERFLDLLAAVCQRFDWRCYAYCLLEDRYRLVVETTRPTLARGMRQLNGVYTQAFNRRHGRQGHVFQGRYQAILVDPQAYLEPLVRDVVRAPLQRGLVAVPGQWRWSSYAALSGRAAVPPWLTTGWLRERYGKDWARRFRGRLTAPGDGGVWDGLRDQVYLGDRAFVERMKARIDPERRLEEVPRAQHRRRPPLEEYLRRYRTPEQTMARAYLDGGYTQREIAAFFDVHYSTVSRAVRAFEKMQEALAAVCRP